MSYDVIIPGGAVVCLRSTVTRAFAALLAANTPDAILKRSHSDRC
jgi:hypothetical protein